MAKEIIDESVPMPCGDMNDKNVPENHCMTHTFSHFGEKHEHFKELMKNFKEELKKEKESSIPFAYRNLTVPKESAELLKELETKDGKNKVTENLTTVTPDPFDSGASVVSVMK